MLTLHPLFGDNAVLQCEQPLEIRGTAEKGTTVSVHLANRNRATVADDVGKWTVNFPSYPAGGPFVLTVASGSETILKNDIWFGEVWLCTGQSNMEWSLGMFKGTEPEIALADDSLLRCFTVARIPADEPAETPDGSWRITTPLIARDISATAYFFAQRLRAELKRPVGILVAAFGGTSIAAWLPASVLDLRPDFAALRHRSNIEATRASTFTPHPYIVRGASTAGWESPEHSDDDWATLIVPGFWQDQGLQHNGAVWYRQTVELSPEFRGQELKLELGPCDDFDDTFFNGTHVGGLGPATTSSYGTRRVYTVPADLTHTSRVTVAVRIFDHWGKGGMAGNARLSIASHTASTLTFSANWRVRVEVELPLRAPTEALPASSLYNGMLHPLRGFSVRGAAWYQGETDAPRAALYRELLPHFISCVRALWRVPDLPVGIVQLPNYKAGHTEPHPSDWAELRDAQLHAVSATPGTGLIVTLDLGEATDIHPSNKKPVGERLAQWALSTVYRHPNTPEVSPLPSHHWCEGDAVYVRFKSAGDTLRMRTGENSPAFQITDATGDWKWADVEIVRNDTIRVWAAGLPNPLAVRYAWQDNPPAVLENSLGLPASPFRTDNWPLETRSCTS